MNGAEYVAEFLKRRDIAHVHCLTGGACAVMIDAISRTPGLNYVCHQHEQSAAMAADAVWRSARHMGVAMATSGPGATNMITGIACAWFDSIPAFYITGQVNMRESKSYQDAKVRQRGFQDTRIVEMVRLITKFAVQVTSAADLPRILAEAWAAALSGRQGPVLVDIPMDVQLGEVPNVTFPDPATFIPKDSTPDLNSLRNRLQTFLDGAERPLILFGAGVGLAGTEDSLVRWLQRHNVPFVASWNGMGYFDHGAPNYCGGIGVYGNRGANFVLQNCDRLLVLGSRLDNRQRSSNSRLFAPAAKVHVVDVDSEELKKYGSDQYETTCIDLKHMPALLAGLIPPAIRTEWDSYVREMRERYLGRDTSSYARSHNTLSPYSIIQRLGALLNDNAVVIGDTGATVCWLFQMFSRRRHSFFTAGGNSPMGYALPAAIGAALENPNREVIAVTGDGGFHLNIHDLQTVWHLRLNVKILVFNNQGYGIIKQFQDSYCEGRHEATGRGLSLPDFSKITSAYGLRHERIHHAEELTAAMFREPGGAVIEIMIDSNTTIEPKSEMGRPINDQFPYLPDDEFAAANRFVRFERTLRI